MSTQERTLPDYNKPPVNEVVLGVQFETIPNFSVVHQGLYWQRIRESYPNLSVHAPIAISKEEFGDVVPPEPMLQAQFLTSPPVPRYWFIDEDGTHLIQLQPERYHYNWKKITGKEEYPHYAEIFPEFEKQWQAFLGFASDEDLGEIKRNHWEVTYVNHIFPDKISGDFTELYGRFPFLTYNALSGNLKTPENVNLSMSYAYPDNLARLHVDIQKAYRKSDNHPLLQFRLTARGQIAKNDDDSLYKGLNLGHEMIVENFTNLTSSNAHKYWERTQ